MRNVEDDGRRWKRQEQERTRESIMGVQEDEEELEDGEMGEMPSLPTASLQ